MAKTDYSNLTYPNGKKVSMDMVAEPEVVSRNYAIGYGIDGGAVLIHRPTETAFYLQVTDQHGISMELLRGIAEEWKSLKQVMETDNR